MIGLVLVTHGRLAIEFRSALEHVVGPQLQIEPVTIGPDDDVEQARRDMDLFTRLSRDFHIAVAEASHNRVLVVQLLSLEHVSWPRRNATATPKLARHIIAIHTQLTDLIEMRDAAGSRALMNDHVKMIRARRVAEHGHKDEGDSCC